MTLRPCPGCRWLTVRLIGDESRYYCGRRLNMAMIPTAHSEPLEIRDGCWEARETEKAGG